jgi:hypothetical protein
MNTKLLVRIKRLSFLCLLLPLVSTSQTKNVISTHRVFPKIDKVDEFEKALAAHAQKYHSGDAKWRVFEIQSGPDFGGFHLVEGPSSWEAFDTRGNLGAEHTNDWNKSIAIYLTERQSAAYSVYVDSLSNVAISESSDKINITHVFPKIGCSSKIVDVIKKLKKAWTAEGSTMAVYSSSSSGAGQFALVTRYKQGLKEKAEGFRKPFKATYESVNGAGSYEKYLESIREYTNDAWSELLFLRTDLGSK